MFDGDSADMCCEKFQLTSRGAEQRVKQAHILNNFIIFIKDIILDYFIVGAVFEYYIYYRLGFRKLYYFGPSGLHTLPVVVAAEQGVHYFCDYSLSFYRHRFPEERRPVNKQQFRVRGDA